MPVTLFFRQNPFVRICLFFIAGIIFGHSMPDRPNIYLLAASGTILLVFISLLVSSGGAGYIKGLIISLLFMGLGSGFYTLKNQHYFIPNELAKYEGIVVSTPKKKSNSYELDAELYRFSTNSSVVRIKEKVRLYFKLDTINPLPETGDSLSFSAHLRTIENRGNPGEFNFKRYMFLKGIKYSGYVNREAYIIGSNSGRYPFRRISLNTQQSMIQQLEDSGIQAAQLGVLSALVAGDRELLDQNTLEQYINAGAMHVLAVSGLHVGILYLFLVILFGNRNNKPYYRLLKLVISLTIIWMYAFITGLSTSVLRASIMFSLFLLGNSFNRHTSSYNLVAVSALIILTLNPNELFNLGFQYSFLAVIGILFFQPRLQSLLHVKHGFIDRIWQLTTVGFAAQLASFPLSLYYFHQFPLYFWVTNLLVIPLVWLIMLFSLVFFITLPLPVLNVAVASLLNLLLKANNLIVSTISNLPYAVFKDIRFENYHLIVFFLVIMYISYLLVRKRAHVLPHVLIALIIVLAGIDISQSVDLSSRKEIVIYNITGKHVISIIDQNNHTLFTKGIDSTLQDALTGTLINYWLSENIEQNINWIHAENYVNQRIDIGDTSLEVFEDNYVISNGNTNILYLTGSEAYDLISPEMSGNSYFLLVDQHTPVSRFTDHSRLGNMQVIFLSGTPAWVKKIWESGITTAYDIREKGAWNSTKSNNI